MPRSAPVHARLSRRQFVQRSTGLALSATGAGLLLEACGNQSTGKSSTPASGSAKSSGPLSMQTSWVPDAEFLGYFIAMENGYYKKAGLQSFNVIPGGPDIAPESVLASGKTLLALTTPDTTASIVVKKNAPFKIIGAQFQKNPIGIMSLPKSNIHEPKDLIGKKLGVPPSNRLTVDALFKANGIDESKVKILPYSFDPTPVANGNLDAAIAFVTTDPFLLKDKGVETSTFLVADFGVQEYNDTVVVTEDALKNRRQDVVNWMKASIMGWNEALDNTAKREQYLELITRKYGKSLGQSVASQRFQLEAEIPLMTNATTKAKGLFWMDDASIQANLDTFKHLKIKADRSLFDTSILEEVYKDGPQVSL
jgi:ABC-type nitrate/sulfonate/bicarbonate transport system substrate-binding protein